MTHVFLVMFTMSVLFPVAKVFQIAFQEQQTFDMSLLPIPDPEKLTAENFSYVVGRTKAEGFGPELEEEDVEEFSTFLASVPTPADEDEEADDDEDDDDEDDDEWEVPEQMAAKLKTKGCFACHMLGEYGRDGLGGDLSRAGRLGKENLKAWLSEPTIENARELKIRPNPSGAMTRDTIWLFGHQLANSVLVALCTTLLGIFLATTAAYAFSRFRFPGRRAGLLGFLVIQMFPGTMMMIPLYILIDRLGLLDQLGGLILVYSTTAIPFCVWMLKGYFDTIPKELEEAAIIDGASRFRIFWSIILPLAKPAIAVTGLFSFMTAWNEFILAATFMNDETATTLPVMLNSFVSSTTVEWGHFAAGAIIVSLPVVILFFALQRHLVGGLTAGGVKG
jgi:arabinogalactan oligomer/maltooligosaccharide transport system permease protein